MAVIADPDTNVWVTAASAWEIAIKTRLGRLDGEALLSAWADIIAGMRTTELPIESPDAILAGRLPGAAPQSHYRDPRLQDSRRRPHRYPASLSHSPIPTKEVNRNANSRLH